jgi:hypothetical protein
MGLVYRPGPVRGVREYLHTGPVPNEQPISTRLKAITGCVLNLPGSG